MTKKGEYRERIRSERRILLTDLLGGKCVECGSMERLHFDHVFPDDKKFDISRNLDYNLEKLLVELQKCQLLCVTHHVQKTITDMNWQKADHGSVSMYTNYKCRCELCRAAWAEYSRDYLKAIAQRRSMLQYNIWG